MKNNFQFTRRVGAAIFLAVVFCSARLFAGTAAESTNAPLKLLPPYGELPPTFWEQNKTTISLAVLAVVILIAFALWRLIRPKLEIAVPPEAQAREALQALCDQPEDGAALSRVSRVLRHYFIAAFHLAGDELTTTEFNRELARSEKISPELSAAAAEFLRECDARKFSPSAESEKMDAANRALDLVEQAEQRRAQLHQIPETQINGRRA